MSSLNKDFGRFERFERFLKVVPKKNKVLNKYYFDMRNNWDTSKVNFDSCFA